MLRSKISPELKTLTSIVLIFVLLLTILPIQSIDNNMRINILPSETRNFDTRAASVPVLDVSMSWTYDFEYENDQGTAFQGTETLAVEAIQDLNLGGFEYEAYRISISGHETFDSGDYTGTRDFTGQSFLRTADLALIKTEKEITTQIDGVPSTNKTDIVETYQPPREDFKFPLENSKGWDSTTHYTRHTTVTIDDNPEMSFKEENQSFEYRIRDEENISLDAGMFFTYSVMRWVEADNPKNYTQYWFSPQVSYIVKEEEWRSVGVGGPVLTSEEELCQWTRNGPPLLMAPMENLTMEEDISDDTIDLNNIFSDPDDDPLVFSYDDPSHMSVSIDSGKVTLTPPLNWYGSDTVTFSASDGISEINATATLNVTVLSVNDPPFLSNGMVTPASGTTETIFSYSITYSDIEGDAPVSASVFIDGAEFFMELPYSVDWKEDIRFDFTTNLSSGNHQYYFSASDSNDTSRLPKSSALAGPLVDPDNYPPELFVPMVTPEEGDLSTDFSFTVDYRDPEGDPAQFCKVFIDELEFLMTPGNGSWSAGKNFTYSATLLDGSHEYYFECSDGITTVRLPVTGVFQGPVIEIVENQAPKLKYWEIKPDTGDEETVFRFSITYLDNDGDEPQIFQIIINGDEYDMTGEGTDYSGGVIFTLAGTFPAGDHFFYFKFGDGTDETRYPVSGELSVYVEETPGDVQSVPTESQDNTVKFILAALVLMITITVIWLLLARNKKDEEVKYAEVIEVTPIDEDMEWD